MVENSSNRSVSKYLVLVSTGWVSADTEGGMLPNFTYQIQLFSKQRNDNRLKADNPLASAIRPDALPLTIPNSKYLTGNEEYYCIQKE